MIMSLGLSRGWRPVQYRIFIADQAGEFLQAFTADCCSDNVARAVAWGRLEPGMEAEVWCRLRRVGQVGFRLRPVTGQELPMSMLAG
jgi:hypothetical protein